MGGPIWLGWVWCVSEGGAEKPPRHTQGTLGAGEVCCRGSVGRGGNRGYNQLHRSLDSSEQVPPTKWTLGAGGPPTHLPRCRPSLPQGAGLPSHEAEVLVLWLQAMYTLQISSSSSPPWGGGWLNSLALDISKPFFAERPSVRYIEEESVGEGTDAGRQLDFPGSPLWIEAKSAPSSMWREALHLPPPQSSLDHLLPWCLLCKGKVCTWCPYQNWSALGELLRCPCWPRNPGLRLACTLKADPKHLQWFSKHWIWLLFRQ